MLDEVILKRERNLKAFCRGLNVLGITDVVKHHPNVARKLFIFEEVSLTPSLFLGLVGSLRPDKEEHQLAFDFFKELVVYLQGMYATLE